jgi:hypothetical protein
MTKAICFYNNGTLDKRAFTMLGLSAKADDKAIGFFGTGFKYAIATLLREGLDVKVHVMQENGDVREYGFFTRRDTFRDKEFDFIHYYYDVPGARFENELPFTTHLGANWKLWQAYRELYTNAIDEGGSVELIEDIHGFNPMAGDVCVYVVGDEFIKVYEQHNKYFIKADTVAEGYNIRCVTKIEDSDNCVYYKTMYTGTQLDKPSHFTYDYVGTVSLTEDRTLADTWSLRHHISRLWLEFMDYDTLIEHLPYVANEKMYEGRLSDDYCTPSADFVRACTYLSEQHRSMPMWARDAFNKSRPFNEQVESFKPNKWQRAHMKRVEQIMHHCGCFIDMDKVITCASLPDDVLGLFKNNIIYIAKAAFERGFVALLGTVYEEWLHMHKHCDDGSRVMQNALVDKVATLMEQLYDTEHEDK